MPNKTIAKWPVAKRLATIGSVVISIERKQEIIPSYSDDILMSIVHSELRKLEGEMGIGLDDIAMGAL